MRREAATSWRALALFRAEAVAFLPAGEAECGVALIARSLQTASCY